MPPITTIKIKDLPPFTEEVEFDCAEQVNLFIGPNGTGKSTVLRHIAEQRLNNPCVFVPASRVGLPRAKDVEGLRSLIRNRPARQRLPEILGEYQSVYEGRIPYYFQYRMAERLLAEDESSISVASYFDALSSAYECTKMICAEILAPEDPVAYIRRNRFTANENIVTEAGRSTRRQRLLGVAQTLYEGMGVSVKHDITHDPDGTYNKLFMGDLSDGTQGTLSWVQYLALRMFSYNSPGSDWKSRPAILLIDEIETHLHPTWQRRVIRALLKHFPGVQIFATTHSPFMVAGLRAGQVHRLCRDERGIIRGDAPNEEDIIGWTIDEILRNLMSVQDPTDEDTAQAAEELRTLQNQGPQESPEDESIRQQRIQELRVQVDRDMLAGGIAAAEQETFERQFNEVLAKYRQARAANESEGVEQ